MMLEISLLGKPRVSVDGQPVGKFPTAKTVALLAYLALERHRTHTREQLIDLLWPDSPTDRGRQNLSQTLVRLRRAFGPAAAVIVAHRHTIELAATADLKIDVAEFGDLLAASDQHVHVRKESCRECQARLAQAVALVRGELLAGVEVSDSLDFEQWLLLERERLHELHLEALSSLADGSLEQGAGRSAIEYARRQIALEAWRERAWRQLIQALALDGQPSAALDEYARLRTILAAELGVEPGSATEKLVAEIRAGRLTAASPTAPSGVPHNLPALLTPFIGREHEMQAIVDSLTQENARLLTITGSGGIGKTRLAQEVGRRLALRPEAVLALEAIWFVSLVGISAAENVPSAIANTLGLPLSDREPAATVVIRQLRDRRVLLILDNFEQVLEGRIWLLALLQAAADVRLIVTSRERLRLLTEERFELRGLSVPPDSATHLQARDYDASKLFLDRARRLYKDFRLTAENWPHVVQICRLTEGLPLGIELAVTLLEDHDLSALVRQITADAGVLATDFPDVAPHHRSMQLIFEQSWQQLSAAEQEVLSRLSVFESEFDRAAARQVAGAQLRNLGALVRKSLVHSDATDRYTLHPLYRAFAARKLPSDPVAVRRAHADYFARLLATEVPAEFDKRKHLRLHSLLPLLPDLRACWDWSVQSADPRLIAALQAPLYRLLRETAQLQEGRALFERAWRVLVAQWPTEGRSPEQRAVLAHIAAHLGFFRQFCGDATGARPCLEYCLAEFEQLNMPEAKHMPLAILSDVFDRLGEYDARLALWEHALKTAESGSDVLQLDRVQNNLAEALYHMDRLDEARDLFLHLAQNSRRHAVPEHEFAITLSNLGLTELALGNLARARALIEQSLQIRRQYGNTYRLASALRSLGMLAIAEGNVDDARQQLQTALDYYAKSGRLDGLGPVHLGLARAALLTGDLATAERQIRSALGYAVQLQQIAQGLDGLRHWGEYLWAAGQPQQGLALLRYVLHHRNCSQLVRREISDFLKQHGATVGSAGPDVDWQTLLPGNLVPA